MKTKYKMDAVGRILTALAFALYMFRGNEYEAVASITFALSVIANERAKNY